jgi:O-antigen biosynthesis protein WbqP
MNRAMDLAIAVAAALALAVPALFVAVAVAVTSPGPILHWSSRSGRHGTLFKMPKFRTMKVGTPQLASDKLQDPKQALTPIGGVLRKLSLDEIPQLWSVIRGDMAIVGPRPALFNQNGLIAARKARGIDALRPGITGWAQVNGRDEIPESKKIELDAEYLRRRSLSLDVRILWLTLWRVAKADGVTH